MTPADEYSERLGRREGRLGLTERLHQRLGTARLGVAASFLLLAWFCAVRRQPHPVWLFVPGGAFVGIVLYHQRVRTLREHALRSVAFYQAGLERLSGRSVHATTSSGADFIDEHHLYGADLDLFGTAGLFPQLCTARTPMGERTLARWLLAPAPVDTVLARQRAVAELSARVDLREDMGVLGDRPHIELHPDAILSWLKTPPELTVRGLRMAAIGLAVLAAAAALVWAVSGIAFPFLLVLVTEAALNYAVRNRVQRAVAGIEHAYEDLKLLATLLARLEAESFEAPHLAALSRRLAAHGRTASVTLRRLATLVNFVEARRNPFLTPLLLPLLYTLQAALAAERWRDSHGAAVESWLEILGEFEALGSLGGYSFERPGDPFPDFVAGPASFSAAGLGHPLIPVAKRVRNDVGVGGDSRVLLVSGSNMSGKSTLLRSVGINTVLAMAGAPVCATRLTLTPLQVGASIRINDSLHEGSSRFYAEITRLRQLFEPAALPLLFLLDELLQGTNSTDRRIGAQGVVKALVGRGAIGLISTHDLTLTDGADFAAGVLHDVHFQDELDGGRLRFDYRLREGVVTRSNGLELMRAIGLDV